MLPTSPPADAWEESAEYRAFRRFARLTALKKELNAKLKLIERELRGLEPPLLGCFSNSGMGQIKIEDFLMSPVREPWVYPLSTVNRKAVCEALKLSGLNYLVTENYSTKSLTKYVRELEEHHQLVAGVDTDALKQLLPRPLAEVIEAKPGFRLQVLDRRPNKPSFDLNDLDSEETDAEGDEL